MTHPSCDPMRNMLDKVFDYHTNIDGENKKEIENLQNKVTKLKEDKETLTNKICEIEKAFRKERDILRKKHHDLENYLKKEKMANAELREKLSIERERVRGWKQKALNKDLLKQDNHFIFEEKCTSKPKAEVYAPMTEQFSDEKNEVVFNDISIGETENILSGHELPSTSSEDECLKSPSVLPVIKKIKVELPKFHEPEPLLIKHSRFETSDDLFAETVPDRKNKIDGYFPSPNQLHKNSFCSSTPIIKTPNNNLNNNNKKKLSLKTDCTTLGEIESKRYKYKEVVRGKAEREKLNGYTCEECEKFYANEQLTDEQRKKILDRCSRHRHKSTPPPSTPDEFWEVGFPPTQEYIEKGLLEVNDQSTPREKLISEKKRKRIKYM